MPNFVITCVSDSGHVIVFGRRKADKPYTDEADAVIAMKGLKDCNTHLKFELKAIEPHHPMLNTGLCRDVSGQLKLT